MDYGADMSLANNYASYLSGANSNIRAHNELMDEQILTNNAMLETEKTESEVQEGILAGEKGLSTAMKGLSVKGHYEKLEAMKKNAAEAHGALEEWVGEDIMGDIKGRKRIRRGAQGDIPKVKKVGAKQAVLAKEGELTGNVEDISMADKVKNRLRKEVKETIGDSADKMESAVKRGKTQAQEALSSIEDTAESVGGKAQEAVQEAKQGFHEATQQAVQQGESIVGESTELAKKSVKQVVETAGGSFVEADSELAALRSRGATVAARKAQQASTLGGDVLGTATGTATETGEGLMKTTGGIREGFTHGNAKDWGNFMEKKVITRKGENERFAETFGDTVDQLGDRKVSRHWKVARKKGMGKSNIGRSGEFDFVDSETGQDWGGYSHSTLYKDQVAVGKDYKRRQSIADLTEHLDEQIGTGKSKLIQRGEKAGDLLADIGEGGNDLSNQIADAGGDIANDIENTARGAATKGKDKVISLADDLRAQGTEAGEELSSRASSQLKSFKSGALSHAENTAQGLSSNAAELSSELESGAGQAAKKVRAVGDEVAIGMEAMNDAKTAITGKALALSKSVEEGGAASAKRAAGTFSDLVEAGELGEGVKTFQGALKKTVGQAVVKGAGYIGAIGVVAGAGMAAEAELSGKKMNWEQHVGNYGTMASAGLELAGMALGATPFGVALELGGTVVGAAAGLLGGEGQYREDEDAKQAHIDQTESMNKEAEDNKMDQMGVSSLASSGSFAASHTDARHMISAGGHF